MNTRARSLSRADKVVMTVVLVLVGWIGLNVLGRWMVGERPTRWDANTAAAKAFAIVISLNQYADSHGRRFPSGNSSTEIFQALLDSGVVKDPQLFWIRGIEGKRRPESPRLTAENVCFDLTEPLSSEPDGTFPVVFLTGFKVSYSPAASAMPLPGRKATRWAAASYRQLRGQYPTEPERDRHLAIRPRSSTPNHG